MAWIKRETKSKDMSESTPNFDLEEQIARIRELLAQTGKLQAETNKLLEEARNRRERWPIWIAGFSALAALVGAFGGAARSTRL